MNCKERNSRTMKTAEFVWLFKQEHDCRDDRRMRSRFAFALAFKRSTFVHARLAHRPARMCSAVDLPAVTSTTGTAGRCAGWSVRCRCWHARLVICTDQSVCSPVLAASHARRAQGLRYATDASFLTHTHTNASNHWNNHWIRRWIQIAGFEWISTPQAAAPLKIRRPPRLRLEFTQRYLRFGCRLQRLFRTSLDYFCLAVAILVVLFGG